jgi:hypothetical protein
MPKRRLTLHTSEFSPGSSNHVITKKSSSSWNSLDNCWLRGKSGSAAWQ